MFIFEGTNSWFFPLGMLLLLVIANGIVGTLGQFLQNLAYQIETVSRASSISYMQIAL
jgi:drug/metabolite transporter (DMT)-like permease